MIGEERPANGGASGIVKIYLKELLAELLILIGFLLFVRIVDSLIQFLVPLKYRSSFAFVELIGLTFGVLLWLYATAMSIIDCVRKLRQNAKSGRSGPKGELK